jgi:hypothetical protein
LFLWGWRPILDLTSGDIDDELGKLGRVAGPLLHFSASGCSDFTFEKFHVDNEHPV